MWLDLTIFICKMMYGTKQFIKNQQLVIFIIHLYI